MKGIYKITSPSGYIYIGQTINFVVRERAYRNLKEKRGFSTAIGRSIIKHGWSNHVFEIVYILPDEVSKDVMCAYEQFFMDQYREAGFTMLNICPSAGSPAGITMSVETRQKLRKANLGKAVPVDVRKKISNALKGVKKTKEHSIRIGQASKGRKHSDKARASNSEKHRSENPHSLPWRIKLKEAWEKRRKRNA